MERNRKRKVCPWILSPWILSPWLWFYWIRACRNDHHSLHIMPGESDVEQQQQQQQKDNEASDNLIKRDWKPWFQVLGLFVVSITIVLFLWDGWSRYYVGHQTSLWPKMHTNTTQRELDWMAGTNTSNAIVVQESVTIQTFGYWVRWTRHPYETIPTPPDQDRQGLVGPTSVLTLNEEGLYFIEVSENGGTSSQPSSFFQPIRCGWVRIQFVQSYLRILSPFPSSSSASSSSSSSSKNANQVLLPVISTRGDVELICLDDPTLVTIQINSDPPLSYTNGQTIVFQAEGTYWIDLKNHYGYVRTYRLEIDKRLLFQFTLLLWSKTPPSSNHKLAGKSNQQKKRLHHPKMETKAGTESPEYAPCEPSELTYVPSSPPYHPHSPTYRPSSPLPSSSSSSQDEDAKRLLERILRGSQTTDRNGSSSNAIPPSTEQGDIVKIQQILEGQVHLLRIQLEMKQRLEECMERLNQIASATTTAASSSSSFSTSSYRPSRGGGGGGGRMRGRGSGGYKGDRDRDRDDRDREHHPHQHNYQQHNYHRRRSRSPSSSSYSQRRYHPYSSETSTQSPSYSYPSTTSSGSMYRPW